MATTFPIATTISYLPNINLTVTLFNIETTYTPWFWVRIVLFGFETKFLAPAGGGTKWWRNKILKIRKCDHHKVGDQIWTSQKRKQYKIWFQRPKWAKSKPKTKQLRNLILGIRKCGNQPLQERNGSHLHLSHMKDSMPTLIKRTKSRKRRKQLEFNIKANTAMRKRR